MALFKAVVWALIFLTMFDLIVFNTRFISGKGIFKSFTGMVKGDYMILIFNACFLYIKL